jgi:dihydroflavonol-4-reductase
MANSDRVLISGVGGFVALHIAREALARGFHVRGSVRSVQREAEIRAALGVDDDRLSFAVCDLERDDGWAQAMHGCRYFLHVASPFPANLPRDLEDLYRPARDGTERVLRAAKAAGIERVVTTSSCAAIFLGHPNERTEPFTEKDWSIADSPLTDPYSRSKTLAERRAWEVANETGLNLVTICPPYILGPLLGRAPSTSHLLLTKILKHQIPGAPDIDLPWVDIRDVAALHVAALTAENLVGKRLMCVADVETMQSLAQTLAELYPRRFIPTWRLPNAVVRLAAKFDSATNQIVPQLGRRVRFDSTQAKSLLGFAPRSFRETVHDSVESLIERGLISR